MLQLFTQNAGYKGESVHKCFILRYPRVFYIISTREFVEIFAWTRSGVYVVEKVGCRPDAAYC